MVTGALRPTGARSEGQEAIADASDAQDARMARFSETTARDAPEHPSDDRRSCRDAAARRLTAGATLGGFRSRIAGIGPQVGFLFPVGDMEGYVNAKVYKEFAVQNRPKGWNAWLTFAISPKAPEAVSPTPRAVYRK
jgi:hypothetical protein